MICSIGVLHNFCINEQILNHGGIGIFCPKNTNFSPEETVLRNAVAEFDRANLVYNFAMAHSNNRECVIQELETYGYSRKGGIGDKRKVMAAKIVTLSCVTLSCSILNVIASTRPYP